MKKKNISNPDVIFFCVVVILVVAGIILVFDASYAKAGESKYTGGDSLYFLKRQVAFAVLGMSFMLVTMRTRYWKLRPLGFILLVFSTSLLGLVLVVGPEVNGSARWLRLGPISVQPSEFAKLGLVMYLATWLSSKGRKVRDLKTFVCAFITLLPITCLVMAQPDMGTTIVLCTVVLAMLFLAGARLRHIIPVIALGMIVFCVFAFSEAYRRERVLSFIDPFKYYHDSGYQVCHSLIALGSGGLFGVGFCEGREKLFYLPAEHTDFIFAVLGEEFGLVGTLLLAGLFFVLGARGLYLAYRTRDSYGRLLAGGATVLICGQALLNMFVVTSSVPATGVPLPFISYGGSSLIVSLICAGLVLSVSKYPEPIEAYENESGT